MNDPLAIKPASTANPPVTAVPDPVATPIRPPARGTRMRRRHVIALISFIAMVALPTILVAAYLWFRAADQYASSVGFSVRAEQSDAALEILGGLGGLTGSSSTDADILYEYLQSQKLVAEIDQQVDLKAIWSKPDNDPFFTFDPDKPVEDLLNYWGRMVKTYYDNATGLIELRVLAFTPEDATLIAERIFEKSSEMINELSAIAQEDAIRYSRDELEAALERLKKARSAVTRFRNENQLIDPTADLEAQVGLLGTLQEALAQALIEVDLLRENTRAGDQRIVQAERRIEVIRQRIDAERRKFGIGGNRDGGDNVFADIVGEYERLSVDREFAEQTYIVTLASYDASVAKARRQSRYLAAYVAPTTAETSRFPERGLLLGMISLFLFLGWASMVLVAYSLRDRR